MYIGIQWKDKLPQLSYNLLAPMPEAYNTALKFGYPHLTLKEGFKVKEP